MRTLLALLALVAPMTAGAAAPPSLTLDRTTAKVGQTVAVTLHGFAAGSMAVELCGDEARGGTADCALTSSVTSYVRAGKATTVSLEVTRPPIDCPCVISAHPVTGGTAVTTPITVSGVPVLTAAQRGTAAAATAGTRKLTVAKVAVHGGGSVGSWLLGSADRTLELTLRNDGTTALTDPALALSLGRGAAPTGIVEAPPLGTLAPGASRSYEIPFTVAAPAFGRYTVRGELTGLDEPIAFTAQTASYPWGLPLLAALAIPLTLLRRRVPSPAPPPVPHDGLTMNQIVAGNLAHWRRLLNLSPEDLAARSHHLWTAAEILHAESGWQSTETHRFDANELAALAEALAIPLPALLVSPPTRAVDSR